ncbi:MAG: PilZ domain-containing protein [Terriglobia bacterium]
MDFRRFLRVPVGVSAVISWADPDGLLQRRKAVARDMSAKGMFLYTDSPPPLGSAVTLEILLPLLRNAVSSMRVTADAKVVRVQPPDEEREEPVSGFAVITNRYTLQDHAEEIPQ